ncbi:Glycerol kinase [Vanrija albida]|uniref:Probable cytosolic iron-sulfur protein assembly protein 1 n=1 Tax=Vanrija albida TaxID=181172 RepID=A0ABR3PX19_9TREE
MPQLQLVADLPGHAEPAWSVAFNPSRPLLASCSTDKTVRLYGYTLPSDAGSSSAPYPSPSAPKPTFALDTTIETGHKRTVRGVAWAPGGRTLATASFDSSVAIWEEVEEGYADDAAEGIDAPRKDGGDEGEGEWECVTTLEGHENECKGVGFSADGGLLASCSRDRSVWVWEVQPDADFECIAVMMDHSADVKAVAWHPKEEILASASYDAHVHLMFDNPDGDWEAFQRLDPALPAADLHIPASASAALLAEMGPSAAELAGRAVEVPPLAEAETVWSLAWSPCGKYLATGGDSGGIRLWARMGPDADAEFVECVHTAAHSAPAFSLAWTPGGEADGLGLLASAGGDGRIIVWQVAAHEGKEGVYAPPPRLEPVAAVREAHGVADVNSIAWNVREDGKATGLLSSAGDDGSVKVWRITADE